MNWQSSAACLPPRSQRLQVQFKYSGNTHKLQTVRRADEISYWCLLHLNINRYVCARKSNHLWKYEDIISYLKFCVSSSRVRFKFAKDTRNKSLQNFNKCQKVYKKSLPLGKLSARAKMYQIFNLQRSLNQISKDIDMNTQIAFSARKH